MERSNDRRYMEMEPSATWIAGAVLTVLGTVLVGLLSWLVYGSASGPIDSAEENRLMRLVAVLLLMGATAWGFGLWQQIFQEPGLDALLVTPLREVEIFWRLWRQQVKWLLLFGGAVSFPAWAWLLGYAGTPDTDVPVWMFLMVPLLVEAWLVASAALGAVLAPLGPLAPGLPMLAMPLFAQATPELEGLLGPLARTWHSESWRVATGLHPVMVAIVMALLITAMLLAVTHVLVRLTYTRKRLIAYRTRHRRPDPTRRNPRGSSNRLGTRPEGGNGPGPIVRRLGVGTMALWQLCRGEEAPHTFVRRVPWIASVALVLAGLTHVAVQVSDGSQVGLELIFVGAFIALGGGMGLFLLRPSLSWRDLRALAQRPLADPSSTSLKEVFPVEIRAYMKISFISGFGLFTLILLLFVPFFLAGPFPSSVAFRLVVTLWVAGFLFAGLTVPAIVPLVDPRRPAESLARGLGAFVVALSVCLLMFFATKRLIDANILPVGELASLTSGHFWLILAGVTLLALVLEGLLLRQALRRHRRRWFDASL